MSDSLRPAGGSTAGFVPLGIAQTMAAEGGRVPFARYMQLALTHATDGYYRGGEDVLGPHGHFTTAPCLSPEFSRAVERIVQESVDAAVSPQGGGAQKVTVLELGGGNGDLAKAVLRNWDRERPDLRERVEYMLLDVSAPLRKRQRRVLDTVMARSWRVGWAASIETALTDFSGTSLVAIGNEFMDVLPVHLIDVRGDEPLEAWVELDRSGDPGLARAVAREVWEAPTSEARAELSLLFGSVTGAELRAFSADGIIELRPDAGRVLGQLATAAEACCLLTIDYGDWFNGPVCGAVPASAYRRTLRGYFRHQAAPDPYARIGRQDLTADVDFRALDLHGRRLCFETVLFTTVAELLNADGGEGRLSALQEGAAASLQIDRRASILRKLLDPDDLGGAFKVMLQVKG